MAGVGARVILELIVGLDGEVEAVRVLKSLPGFDDKAIEAVRKWKYKPALRGGQPVMCFLTVIIDFSVGERSSSALSLPKTLIQKPNRIFQTQMQARADLDDGLRMRPCSVIRAPILLKSSNEAHVEEEAGRASRFRARQSASGGSTKVTMVESAQYRLAHDLTSLGWIHIARDRSIAFQ